MKNIEISPGGLIGALVCGGITIAIVFATFDLSTLDQVDSNWGIVFFIVFAFIGGSFAGNFLWRRIFEKHK